MRGLILHRAIGHPRPWAFSSSEGTRSGLRAAARAKSSVSAAGQYDDLPYTTAGTPEGDSNKVGDYLRSPFDVAAFGTRLAVGTVLSAEEIANSLQKDLEKLQLLVQDPRPPQDKQQALAKAVEKRMTSYLQRGAAAEAEVLTALASLLPADVQAQMPPQLKDVLLRGTTGQQVPPTPPAPEEAAAVPIAAVARNQTAAELVDLKASVSRLRQSLAELNLNTDPAQEGVLRVNVVDARTGLSRRLQQLSPAARTVEDVPIQAAIEEANGLLREVDSLRL